MYTQSAVYMYTYLEFSIGLADVDNELVPLFLQIRALQSHHVTVHVYMYIEAMIHQYRGDGVSWDLA